MAISMSLSNAIKSDPLPPASANGPLGTGSFSQRVAFDPHQCRLHLTRPLLCTWQSLVGARRSPLGDTLGASLMLSLVSLFVVMDSDCQGKKPSSVWLQELETHWKNTKVSQ